MNNHKQTNLILVTNVNCVKCAQVKEILKRIAPDFPGLNVREIDMTTDEGREFINKYSIMSSPGIIIDDKLFSMGGTTEKELREKLKEN